MKKTSPRSGSKRPTATIDIKAKEIKSGAPTSAREKAGAKPADTKAVSAASRKAAPGVDKNIKSKTTDKKAGGGKPPANGTSKAAPPSASASGGGGFLSHLLASLIGAVLGIFGLSYANNNNMMPAGLQMSGGTQVKQQITSLGDKIGMLERQTSSRDANSLGGQMINLNARLEKAEAALGNGAPGARSLAEKVGALETTINNLEQAAKTGKGGKLAGLTAVTRQLAKSGKQTLALKSEFTKLREQQSGFREDLASVRSAQADFQSSSAKISDDLAKLQNSTAKIVADARRPPDVSAQINPVVAMLGDLTAKIDGVLTREQGSKAEGRNIALALSLGELKRAVNQGVPYQSELTRVLPHAPKNLNLSALERNARQGLVPIVALRTSFSTRSQQALASENTSSSGSFVDQLMANAKSMVQVRPTGFVKGDTTGAVLSRMEYKLRRDDLSGSLKESEALRGRAKDVMRPWLDQAASRLGGDVALRALEDKIRNSLAGVTPSKG